MPFIVISDPVEAHKYRQEGLLWFYSHVSRRWGNIRSPTSKNISLAHQRENMEVFHYKYGILVEEEDE